MDFLGSILGSMTGPPKATQEEQEKRKKQREMAKKLEDKQREMTKMFRQKIESKINDFMTNNEIQKLEFGPMSLVERQVVKDVSEIAGIVAHTFGEEGIDRHVVIWKKESTPSEDELSALRQGKVWDPVEAAKEKEERLQMLKQEEMESKKQKDKFVPKTNYQEKYHHLIGSEAALSAARKTEVKKSFGMVSAESKKDKRTVEDIQADIKKKKLKLSQHADDNPAP